MPTRKKKRGQPKKMKPLNQKVPNHAQPCQHDVMKAQEKPKIKPQEIFEMMGATYKKK
jgi:hypothetical protein